VDVKNLKIKKTNLPINSILTNSGIKYHYVDSYIGQIDDERNEISSTDLGKAFFSSGPKWTGHLFTLRNKIVVLFGLKTNGKVNDRQQQLADFKCVKGEELGLFKVYHKSENEVVLGQDDKHLNFRVSLFVRTSEDSNKQKEIIITTTVVFNNWFGRLYFLPVKPFHSIIVPVMLKGIIKSLIARILRSV